MTASGFKECKKSGVGIYDLDGERLARVPPSASISQAAAAGGRLLLRTRDGDGRVSFHRLDWASGKLRRLSGMTLSAWYALCAAGLIALSPGGGTEALHCPAHLQTWQVSDDGTTASLATVLPVLAAFATANLAFSGDGSRLVAGPDGTRCVAHC